MHNVWSRGSVRVLNIQISFCFKIVYPQSIVLIWKQISVSATEGKKKKKKEYRFLPSSPRKLFSHIYFVHLASKWLWSVKTTIKNFTKQELWVYGSDSLPQCGTFALLQWHEGAEIHWDHLHSGFPHWGESSDAIAICYVILTQMAEGTQLDAPVFQWGAVTSQHISNHFLGYSEVQQCWWKFSSKSRELEFTLLYFPSFRCAQQIEADSLLHPLCM